MLFYLVPGGFSDLKHLTFNNLLSLLYVLCVRFWLLAHESCNLIQAETKITLVKKAEQNHKMTPICTQNDDIFFQTGPFA